MFINVLHQLVLILAHFEEVRLFLCLLHLASAVGAFAVHKLRVCPETFARRTVPALVIALVYIALVVESFKYLLHRFFVIIVGGSDKFVVAYVEHIGNLADLTRNFVNVLLWGNTLRFGYFLYLLTVLVCTGKEKYVLADKAVKTRDCIC